MTRSDSDGGRSDPAPERSYRFSYGRFVFFALGVGVLVLLVSIPIIIGLARWSPIAGLVGVLAAVIAMVAAIGATARRQLTTAERAILADRDRHRPPRS